MADQDESIHPCRDGDAWRNAVADGTLTKENAKKFNPFVPVTFDSSRPTSKQWIKLHREPNVQIPKDMTRASLHSKGFGKNSIRYSNGYHGIHFVLNPIDGRVMSCFIEVTNAEKVLEYPSVSKSMPVNVAGLTKKGYYETENSTSIAVEIVSQKEVYEALFPTCTWTEETVDTSKSFEGFTNPRILTQLRDLARRPDHYPAVHSRPEAPYEFLMSLLLLYPWDRDDLITVAERDNLYRCTLDLVKMLKAWDEPTRNQQKKFKKYSTRLGEPLMLNLVNIAFHHTGFSPRQRSAIVLAGRPTQIAGYHDLWAECRFNAVTWIRRCDRDLINYYAELLGESDESGIMRRFSLWKDSFLHERRDRLSLRTVAEVELLMIDGLLIQAVELQRTR